MKFFEGVLVGSLLTVGTTWMYNGGMQKNDARKMMKKGKQFAKKLGLI